MFRCIAEYYNQLEPITTCEFRALTKLGAVKKAMRFTGQIQQTVYWVQVWFRGKKIFGNGNKILWIKNNRDEIIRSIER